MVNFDIWGFLTFVWLVFIWLKLDELHSDNQHLSGREYTRSLRIRIGLGALMVMLSVLAFGVVLYQAVQSWTG